MDPLTLMQGWIEIDTNSFEKDIFVLLKHLGIERLPSHTYNLNDAT